MRRAAALVYLVFGHAWIRYGRRRSLIRTTFRTSSAVAGVMVSLPQWAEDRPRCGLGSAVPT
jgi:hypothetical protein